MLQEYTLKLSAQQIQTLVTALQEAPFRVAQPLMALMESQVREQEAAAREAASTAANDEAEAA